METLPAGRSDRRRASDINKRIFCDFVQKVVAILIIPIAEHLRIRGLSKKCLLFEHLVSAHNIWCHKPPSNLLKIQQLAGFCKFIATHISSAKPISILYGRSAKFINAKWYDMKALNRLAAVHYLEHYRHELSEAQVKRILVEASFPKPNPKRKRGPHDVFDYASDVVRRENCLLQELEVVKASEDVLKNFDELSAIANQLGLFHYGKV